MRAAGSRPVEALAVARMPHVRVLDGLRAVAVLLVFIGHLHLVPRFPGGFGVTVFFFLSGFLITTLLRIERARTAAVSIRGFYLRRLLRINPPLWLTMAALLALAMLIPPADLRLDPRHVISQAFFLTNYYEYPLWGPTARELPPPMFLTGLPMPLWSLAVEEHFYLAFPALFALAMRRLDARRMALACALACGAVLAIRLLNIAVLGVVEENYYWSHTRIDSILFGCILALWQNPLVENAPWRPRRWHVAVATAVLVASNFGSSDLFREGLRYSLQGGALFVLFSALMQTGPANPVRRLLECRPMQLIGLWSYTLYLVHYGVIAFVRSSFPELPHAVNIFLVVVLSLAWAAAMHRFVERPLGWLRQRMNRSEEPDSRLAGHRQAQPAE